MLYSEFVERTHIEPSYEEYHYIEDSYYEFNGCKDEFCQKWLKDRKSGKWEMELRFRKALDQQKKEYESKLAEHEENLEFYRPYFERARKAEAEAKALRQKLDKLTVAVQVAARIAGKEVE